MIATIRYVRKSTEVVLLGDSMHIIIVGSFFKKLYVRGTRCVAGRINRRRFGNCTYCNQSCIFGTRQKRVQVGPRDSTRSPPMKSSSRSEPEQTKNSSILEHPSTSQSAGQRGSNHVSGRVSTYFDRVGTAGMERDYSWSFVPFQAACVHSEFPRNRAPDPNTK